MSSNKNNSSQQPAKVVKCGYLRKIKSTKKRYFVLQDALKPRLEYYENEKKFKNGASPKRTIIISDCFNINNKGDSKHKTAIALYTRDDCFTVLAENSQEQEEWLTAMLQLREKVDAKPQPDFEHIWQVMVKQRGLGNKNLTGGYRLCLTSETVNLVKMSNNTVADDNDIVFPLSTVRRCGHSDCFFFMEVGRSAMTGAGELWMQVDDTVISQNMHEAILSAMRSMSQSDESIRPRSRSIGNSHDSANKPIGAPSTSRRMTAVGSFSTRRQRGGPDSPSNSVVSSPANYSKNPPSYRARTCSEGETIIRARMANASPNKTPKGLMPAANHQGSPNTASMYTRGRHDSPGSTRYRVYSLGTRAASVPISNSPPVANSPLSESPASVCNLHVDDHYGESPLQNDTSRFHLANEEYGAKDHHMHWYSRSPDSPQAPIREEESTETAAEDYMVMSLPNSAGGSGSYLEMSTAQVSSVAGGGNHSLSMTQISVLSGLDGRSVSPASFTSVHSRDDSTSSRDSGYMNMTMADSMPELTSHHQAHHHHHHRHQHSTESASDSYMSMSPVEHHFRHGRVENGLGVVAVAAGHSPASSDHHKSAPDEYVKMNFRKSEEERAASGSESEGAPDTYMSMDFSSPGGGGAGSNPAGAGEQGDVISNSYMNMSIAEEEGERPGPGPGQQNGGGGGQGYINVDMSPAGSGVSSVHHQRSVSCPVDTGYVAMSYPAVTSDYMNMQLTRENRGGQEGATNGRELNYVDLDLSGAPAGGAAAAATLEAEGQQLLAAAPTSPRLSSSPAATGAEAGENPGYSSIDFTKSEVLQKLSSKVKESRIH